MARASRPLPRASEDLKTLTASTYAAADPSYPKMDSLKARTRTVLDGEMQTSLPSAITVEDQSHLDLH